MPLKNGRQSADLQTILVGSVIPSGTIAPFGGGTVPAGWMLCDGTAISRTTYSALFAAINTTYGVGDGVSTFNLPDARGVFLRGLDEGRGLDVGRALGSYQDDEFKSHTHGMTRRFATSPLEPYNLGSGSDGGMNSTSPTDATGGVETRPKNIAVNHIIKL